MKSLVLLVALLGAAPVLAAPSMRWIGQACKYKADTGATERTCESRAGDQISVKDYGAKGDGTTDDADAIQAALNTGKDVTCVSGLTYKLTKSLYMNTAGQRFSGNCVLTMDAALAKPMLWLGATDTAGTAPGSAAVNMKVGTSFSCTGVKTLGSAGIAFQRATTATLESVKSWNCYAGIDVRGLSLANTLLNPDLRQNTYGLYDRTDATGTIDFQATQVIGGRIESNVKEGIITGSSNIKFIGTVIEGNAAVASGGNGTDPEIRITAGYATGGVDLIGVYMETLVANTGTAMIRIDAPACRFVKLSGGQFYVRGVATRYLVETNSACTTQSISMTGIQVSEFKNYIHGAILNASWATVMPNWADATRDVTADLSVTAGASLFQFDRVDGLRTIGTGGVFLGSVTFAQLGTPVNGKINYCTDCTVASPCAGGGTGAIAKRVNGAWVCN